MSEVQLLEFPQWDLAAERLPERSKLYAPAPVGMGTTMGESLTSYLARLAAAHCVYPGILLREMILPMLQETETQDNLPEQHPLWRRDGSGSHLINVTGSRAQAALQVLETLTMRADLEGLSLTALTEILPLRGLTRSRLAWCPICYEEWQANEQAVYDPLLWKFREISLCVHHGVRLQTSCPNCARSLPHLAWRSRPGYCPFCAWPLFGEQAERQEPIDPEMPEFAWQQWVTETLGTVVAQLPSTQGCPKRERIQLVLNHAVRRLASGNIAAFARLLDLPRNTLENWCRGKRIPELDMLLRLCYRLALSLTGVLFQETEALQPRLQNPIPEARFQPRKQTAIDKERIGRLLEEVAGKAEDPPLSLQEVGQRLGYQPTTLYKINRAACHVIAERYIAYRRELREKRLQGYREEIRRIALYLRAEQVALTQKYIARYLAQPAILRDPEVRKLLHEVCREVEAADSAARMRPNATHEGERG
jgi:transcriptional regulator with XRE-family HTH domain